MSTIISILVANAIYNYLNASEQAWEDLNAYLQCDFAQALMDCLWTTWPAVDRAGQIL